jgi:hypothetical protein
VKSNRDGGFKLRSPSKITLDINTCRFDSKIKIVLSYEYLEDIRSNISDQNTQK